MLIVLIVRAKVLGTKTAQNVGAENLAANAVVEHFMIVKLAKAGKKSIAVVTDAKVVAG